MLTFSRFETEFDQSVVVDGCMNTFEVLSGSPCGSALGSPCGRAFGSPCGSACVAKFGAVIF